MTERLRALFFGTPAFAVPCLDALAEIAEIVGVVCQPDKPAGRGMELAAPPVKTRALALGAPVVQPAGRMGLRTGEFGAWVRAQNADVALVVAYGRILPKDVLEGPRLGCVNVHASLLPKFRGAAPITWAVVHGERESGVTLMLLDEGMDTGAMLAKYVTPIDPDETAGQLGERLAQIGAQAVRDGLPKFARGELTPEKQNDAEASLAPMLKKEDGRVDWTKRARAVHDHVRGMSPWPGATTTLAGKLVKLHKTQVAGVARAGAKPGEVIVADKAHLIVACGEGAVELSNVQLEGKKAVRGVEWVMGRGVKEADVLG
jgi:methionyl-tRNA formyltransferase